MVIFVPNGSHQAKRHFMPTNFEAVRFSQLYINLLDRFESQEILMLKTWDI